MAEAESKRRGRKPKVMREKQFSKYRSLKSSLITDDFEIKPYNDVIFKQIGVDLEMTPKAVHWAVLRNIKEIFDEDEAEMVISKNRAEIAKIMNIQQEGEIDYLFNESDDKICAIINIADQKDSFYFQFVQNEGPSRAYTSLRPGWADALFQIIVRETQTICIYSFKRANIRDDEFRASGVCTECAGTVTVESQQNRRKLRIEMVKGPQPHTNTKFRRLTSTTSSFIAAKLANQSVNNVYLQQAEGISMETENLPRDFIRKKSIENVRTKLNSQKDSAIDSLRILKFSDKYGESIKEIQSDPFGVIFWTKVQQHVYREIAREYGAAISLDATGGLIDTKSLLSGIYDKLDLKMGLPHVFLYLISVKHPDGKSTPVGQMLSSQQDSIKISYFLDRWKADFSIPREITVDDSKALQKSCAKSFNECKDTNDYIHKCFNVLAGNRSDLPKTYIRLDAAHYIKNLHKQKELKRMNSEVRQLYLAVFGFLMQCENFEEIRRIFEQLLILANGFDNDQNNSQKMLNDLVRTHDICFVLGDTEENVSDDEEAIEEDFTEAVENIDGIHMFDEILKKLSVKSKPMQKSDVYYNPKLNQFFRAEFKRLPLWTAVMKPFFRSPYTLGISNDTEARFKAFKHHVFDDVSFPIRSDIFVRRTLDAVDNIAKLNRLEVKLSQNLLQANRKELALKSNEPQSNEPQSHEPQSNEPQMEETQEDEPFDNWHGKGQITTPKQQKKHRSVNSILNKQVTEKITFTKIAILNDGYLPRTRKSKIPLVQNTGGFDVACYVILCKLVDDDEFKTKSLGGMNETMSNFVKIYIEKGAHTDTYIARNAVLMEMFEKTVDNGIEVINCKSTPIQNIEKIYTNKFPSAIASCNCAKRKLKKQVSILEWQNVENVFNYSDSCENFKCKKCLSETSVGTLVFINTYDQQMRFNVIPQAIVIASKVCILSSIIHIIREDVYIVHTKRCNQAWYTFDHSIQKVSVAQLSGEKMKIHMLVYMCVSTIKTNISKKSAKENSQSFEVIKNFHTCFLNEVKVNVKNVCGPDALFHILCKIHEGNENIFDEKFKESTLFSLISAFNSIDESAVYYYRAILLIQKRFSVSVESFNEITINCDSNVFNAVQMLTSDCLPSVKVIIDCEKCGHFERHVSVLEIDFTMLTEKGINALSSCILFQGGKKQSDCNYCHQKQKVEVVYSNVVFIDVQPMTTMNGKIALPKLQLKSLPLTIEIANETYNLKGVIEFQLNEYGLSHYIAHCYDNSEWIAFDDLLLKQQKSTSENLEPHVLVYTI